MTITVVGAGIIGCAVAHELASRGARVRVLDPRGVALGATHASAGILAPYIEGHIAPLLELGLSSLALYEPFVERVRARARTPFEYERSGTLQVALTGDESKALAAIAKELEAARESHSVLDARQVRELEPSLSERVVGGLLVGRHGYVTAAALTAALAEAAAACGATFSTARVETIDSNGGSVRLETSDGPLEGDAVIVAAGSWASRLGMPGVPVAPVRGQLLHLGMPARAASRVIWRGACYLVPWLDRSVLVGATVEDVGFDESATVKGVQTLLDAAIELIPGLAGASLREVRVGLRPGTPDELPVVGPSSTMRNVFFATGHYRSGVLLAPLTAALIADLVLDGCERRELALMRPARFGL